MCGLPTGLRAPCGQGSAGSAGRGVLQVVLIGGLGRLFHPVANAGGARLVRAACAGRGGNGRGGHPRGGRRMTHSNVMGLPQQGHVGAGGGVGVGLGAAWVPRIWCRRSRFLFAAALSHP